MPDKMNLEYLKVLYCEFQKYEVMTMSVVSGQSNKHATHMLTSQAGILKAAEMRKQT